MISFLSEENQYSDETKAMQWLLSQIDYKKLTDRIRCAKQSPDSSVKCVLVEYNYTPMWYVLQGNTRVTDYLNGSCVPLNTILRSKRFNMMLQHLMADFNPDIKFYVRQKICQGGCPDYRRHQLVILIKPYAFTTRPCTPPPSRNEYVGTEYLDSDDDYTDMPPLIPASKNF